MKTITISIPDDFKVPEGYEVQIVKKGEKKEPVIRTYQDLIHYKKEIKGYWADIDGKPIPCYSGNLGGFSNTIAASEKVAKSMLAMAMISQLMPYYGGAITDEEWNDLNINKYIIYKFKGNIHTSISNYHYYYLAFHTEEQRDEFLKNNEDLIKDYLII